MRVLLLLSLVAGIASGDDASIPLDHRVAFWPNGRVRTSATYLSDVRHGEYRTWRANGTPYELRHYDRGRESGVQQSWDEQGELFLNYEMRHGRRYGFINAVPCLPADGNNVQRGGSQ